MASGLPPNANPENKINTSDMDVLRAGGPNAFMDTIEDKLKHVRHNRIPHSIDCRQYPTVYVTSDIHADLRKFIQMLQHAGLANIPVNPYDNDVIYERKVITDVEWTMGPNVLLVIVGDLLEGRRGEPHKGDVMEVDDKVGNFEVLLLSLIFNLGIDARMKGSNVLFTLGNHDIVSSSQIFYNEWMYKNFVTDAARKYFGKYDTRLKVFSNFLKTSPYFLITLLNNGVPEIGFVHAGLHRLNKSSGGLEDLIPQLLDIQSKLDADVRDAALSGIKGLDLKKDDGPLWTTAYSENHEGVCDKLGDMFCRLLIVGHCRTDLKKRMSRIISNDRVMYAGCDHEELEYAGGPLYGCVVADCVGADGMPKLTYVDTGLSRAMRKKGSKVRNKDRIPQFLRLTHVEDGSDRFYNRIEAVWGRGHGESRLLYPQVAAAIPGPGPGPAPPAEEPKPEPAAPAPAPPAPAPPAPAPPAPAPPAPEPAAPAPPAPEPAAPSQKPVVDPNNEYINENVQGGGKRNRTRKNRVKRRQTKYKSKRRRV